MEILTLEERLTIEKALAIIHGHMLEGSSFQFGASHYVGCGKSSSVCYFSTAGAQISDTLANLQGSFSDKIDQALQFQAGEPPKANLIRDEAIAYHKSQLSVLEGEK